MYSMLIIK